MDKTANTTPYNKWDYPAIRKKENLATIHNYDPGSFQGIHADEGTSFGILSSFHKVES